MFEIEVYRTRVAAKLEDRAFMLRAVGIDTLVHQDDGAFVLLVQAEQEQAARAHLDRYANESRPLPIGARPAPVFPLAWQGAVLYAMLLIGASLAIWSGVGPLDAYSRGVLDGARVQAGEVWRAWTSLTLHADLGHVVSNAGFGLWFGALASRHLGPGTAWLLIALAGGGANLLEGLFGPAEHRALGASTAVFAAIGLLTAFTWREQYGVAQRWAVRWGPLVVGVILLGWFGSQGEDGKTDVIAHVLGFAIGAIVGVITATRGLRRAMARLPQWLTGVAAIGVFIVAWGVALR